jgi:enoyl-CoA hydratase
MSLNFNTLKVEKIDNHILLVTLNRPESRNAINSVMMLELRQLWQDLYVNNEKLRCVILTGVNPAFSAGADLKERNHISLDTWQAQHAVFEQAMLAMIDCPIPIIAAVNGAAFGGGLELALASDFAYAVDTAIFAQSEVKIGIMPAALGTQHLPRTCGLRRAKELAFTGDTFSAHEALEWGIINKVYSATELMPAVLATAKKIADNAPLAIQQVKKSLNISQQADIKTGFSYEIEAYNRLLPTQDREEGIRAFNEKRKAEFIGK